jgi:hypothetical protein
MCVSTHVRWTALTVVAFCHAGERAHHLGSIARWRGSHRIKVEGSRADPDRRPAVVTVSNRSVWCSAPYSISLHFVPILPPGCASVVMFDRSLRLSRYES